jgi:hypothetical protein
MKKTTDAAAPEQGAAAQPDAVTATDQAQASQPEAATQAPKAYDEAYIKDLLTRNGLKKAWILPGDHVCFDKNHAKHVAGKDFDSLTTISI